MNNSAEASVESVSMPVAKAPASRRRRKGRATLWIGIGILGAMLILTIIGNTVPPQPVNTMNILQRLLPPSAAHWFGTDEFGRDVLSRAMAAGGPSFIVGFGSVLFGALAGTILGAISGFFRGWLDSVVMRFMDGLYAFPHLLLALLIILVLGNGVLNTLLAIGLFNVPVFARLVRAEVLRIRTQPFVEAAESYGTSPLRIVFRHILPSALPTIFVQASSSFGVAVIVEATLSFLGLGVQPPTPSWGNMLFEYRGYMTMAPWLPVFPGVMLLVTVLGANQLAIGLKKLFA